MRTRLGGRAIDTWREKSDGSILAASKFNDYLYYCIITQKLKQKYHSAVVWCKICH